MTITKEYNPYDGLLTVYQDGFIIYKGKYYQSRFIKQQIYQALGVDSFKNITNLDVHRLISEKSGIPIPDNRKKFCGRKIDEAIEKILKDK